MLVARILLCGAAISPHVATVEAFSDKALRPHHRLLRRGDEASSQEEAAKASSHDADAFSIMKPEDRAIFEDLAKKMRHQDARGELASLVEQAERKPTTLIQCLQSLSELKLKRHRQYVFSEGTRPASYARAMAALRTCAKGDGEARPGSPRLAGLAIEVAAPLDEGVAALGNRIVELADAKEALKLCGSFFTARAHSWCSAVMPPIAESAEEGHHVGHTCSVDGFIRGGGAAVNEAFLALWCGPSESESDHWSELMNNVYLVRTRRVKGSSAQQFDALLAELSGRAAHSTFVKLDVGGDLWKVLKQLLRRPKDIDRIRTLDMKVDLSSMPDDGISLADRVAILEDLGQHFAVTGSTIEHLAESAHRTFMEARQADPSYSASLGAIYTGAGNPLDTFTISYVNRALLTGGLRQLPPSTLSPRA